MANTKKTILLAPFHQHLSALYEGCVAKGCAVVGLVHHSHIGVRQVGQVKVEPMRLFVGYPLIFYRWFSIGFQVPRAIIGFAAKVQKVQPEAVVIFDFYHWYFLQALWLKRKNPALKIIVYSESKRWPRRWLSTLLLRFFLRYAQKHQAQIDKVLVYTKEGRDFLRQYIAPKKILILPAPIDTSMFRKSSVKVLQQEKKEFTILCNARFDAYKNHRDLLQALRIVIDQGYGCQLTLIGRAESGRERVEKFVQELALTEQVDWLEPLPIASMPELYRRHDVLILTSYNEALGMVVPEAMACGVSTITSDTVGANVYVLPGETGLIFETGNVQDLVEKLKVYLDNPELCNLHGSRAAQHIEENFSVDKITDQFLSLV